MRLVLISRFRACRLLGAAMVLCLLFSVHSMTQAGTVQPLQPVTEADGRLGLCDVLPGGPAAGTSWAQLAAAAGARTNRWEFRWDRIESQPGSWNFAADDQAVQASLDAGLGVEGILIGTPRWAAADGQRPGNGVPRGLSLSYTDPRNSWAAYVRGVVLHYRGTVRTWEIWNEPDLKFFWTGTSEDYYHLMHVAFRVIKEIDPNATVLMGGLVAPDLGFATRVVADAARDSSPPTGSFDGIAWHAYGQAALIYSNIERLRSLLAAHGFGQLAIWVTEDGFPASNPSGEPRQAAYVLQTVAYAMAAGATHVLVYRESDDTGSKTWGLLTPAGQPRMGYLSFQVAAHYFSHTQSITYDPVSTSERFELYQPGRRATLLWTKGVTSQTVAVAASGPTASVVDWQGNVSQVTATSGQFHLVLPGASYNAGIDAAGSVVGGPPLLLLEDNAAPTSVPPAAFIPSLAGRNRRLILYNQSASEATAQVASTENRRQRAVYSIPSGAVQIVDLDLLAGPNYTGSYSVSAPPGISYGAASDQTLASGSTPAPVWYAATAPGLLTLSNPGRASVRTALELYAPSGRQTLATSFTIGAGSSLRWPLPRALGRVAAAIHASGPIVVAGDTLLTARPDLSWYLVRPGAGSISIFNPGVAGAQVDVRYVGSDTVTGQQLRLKARHSYSVSTHGAKAMIIAATRAVAVGHSAGDTGLTQAIASPSTANEVTAAGPATRVTVFNPSSQPAHIAYTLVSRTQSVQHALEVAPSHLSTFVARRSADAARGVALRSDVPVVAVPAR